MSWYFPRWRGTTDSEDIKALIAQTCDQEIRIKALEKQITDMNTRISGVSLAAGLRPKPKTEKAE